MENLIDEEMLALESLINTYMPHGRSLMSSANDEETLRREKEYSRMIVKIFDQLREKKPDLKMLHHVLLNAESKYVRLAAAEALKQLKRKRSLPNLFKALEEETDPEVKEEIIHALVSLGVKKPRSLPRIITETSHNFDRIIVNA